MSASRTPGGHEPSSWRGDQPAPGRHCEPQPAHAHSAASADDQSHAERHGDTTSGAAGVVTPPSSPYPPGCARAGCDGGGAARLTATLRGRVQGVGMRWWVRAHALALGLVGSATNCSGGRVEVVAEGCRGCAAALLAVLEGREPQGPAPGAAPRPGRVDHVAHTWGPPRGGAVGFVER